MPLSGNDPAARSIAHMRYAERYARHKKALKSIAHFGRAMHYGAPDPPRVYNVRIDIHTGFLDYHLTEEEARKEAKTYECVILNAAGIRSTVQFVWAFDKLKPHAEVSIWLTDINGKKLDIPINDRAILEEHIREVTVKRGEWKIPNDEIKFKYMLP